MAKHARQLANPALALETSSALGRVALGRGTDILETRELSGLRRHAVDLLPAVAALCELHGVRPETVDRVYVSTGPGSFTGLRMGITIARMISLAGGAKLVAVPTLEVIAQNALRIGRDEPHPHEADADGHGQPPDRVAVVLDAKRGRVYAAAFVRRVDRYVAVSEAVEADPERFLADQAHVDPACAVLGEGVLYHRDAVRASGLPILAETLYPPLAEVVYRLGLTRADEGRFVERRMLVPTYVRPPEAEEKWQQRRTEVRSTDGRQR